MGGKLRSVCPLPGRDDDAKDSRQRELRALELGGHAGQDRAALVVADR